MNYLRLSLAAGALTVLLALPAFAGYMDTTVASPPPATGQMETTSTEAVTGDMGCPGVSDSVTEIALSIVQDMLSLF